MCGIVGYIGDRNAVTVLLNGLRRLEYRGYDSSGIAVLNGKGLELRRQVGKLKALESYLQEKPAHGTLGLGHTRWATHGRPSEENAHPHTCCRNTIAVVHNGIVENHAELRARLEGQGHAFKSQTDTEIFAHLIEENLDGDLVSAVRSALRHIRGSYALAVMSGHDRERLVVARKDSPLVLGLGDQEMFVASDVPALLPYTRRVIFLEDGELAEVAKRRINLYDAKGASVSRSAETIHWDAAMAEKAGYKHFMLKEIFEQPDAVQKTWTSRFDPATGRLRLEDILSPEEARLISKISLIGCGTSYHAALVGRYWMEEIAGISCDVDMASEARYRHRPHRSHELVVSITQSGETADTLAALREAKTRGLLTLAVCNVLGSTATREAGHTLYTRCGPEIGVASTKAFTGQLTALFLLALYLVQCRKAASEARPLASAFAALPAQMDAVLNQAPAIQAIAKRYGRSRNSLFLGRHLNYPIALEGALKLKEISYIHAEGYAAGEMKHGPIALIEEGLPVVVIAPASSIREKMLSNMEEVKARGGAVIAVATEGDQEVAKKADVVVSIPPVPEALAPFLTILPLQLLAYEVAVLRGCDVDQPRNLAKSVTVE